MKLLTLKCIKDPERMDECFEPDNQEERYFVKLDTKFEENVYRTICEPALYSPVFDEAMLDELGVKDEDVYYYFLTVEPEPAVGEQYTDADGLVWERVK